MSNNITFLFERYTTNLSICLPDVPELKDQFICPLCLGIYGRNALQASDADRVLTVEHVIPDSLVPFQEV
jgi:hypothetical protein